jgi:glucosamine-6-phosphate deaminase
MSNSPIIPSALRSFRAGQLQVEVHPTNEAMGRAAAAAVAARLGQILAGQAVARVILATGNSQFTYTASLLADFSLPWDRIECFHMDEYVGMDANHPASFRRWMRERVESRAHPRGFHYIRGDNPDPQAECARYAALLAARPIDVISLGVGENGHIAFNDPPVADFHDPAAVKIVPLDEACKRQQVGEGHFPNLAAVPTHAITLTIPTLLNVGSIFCLVPEARKAPAVRAALEGPIATACPASILRNYGNARLFLDAQSAALLT